MYCQNEGLVKMQWRGLLLFMIAPIYLQVLITGVKAASPSVASCPQYVAENGTLYCMCFKPDSCVPPYTLYWVGHDRDSEVLVVPAVKREDDGKQYTCQLTCAGQISTVNYTLRVAHGPGSVSIAGKIPFKTDGMQVLSLTCLATDVYPAVEYSWLPNSTCTNNSNGTTCSFVPQRDDDLKVVTCTAYNSGVNRLQHQKNFTINLQYTPLESPRIQGPSQFLKVGDTLSCSVTGGKPLVASVNFTCDNPQHNDQNDTVNSTSVTSYITIDTSQANDDNMTCHCSAHWAPEPGYYTNSVIASFRTEYPAKIESFTWNDGMDTVTVTASHNINVTLMCEAHGLPSPTITLQGPNNDYLNGHLTHTKDTDSRMEQTIVMVNDTHMGNYTCKAVSRVINFTETSLITLNVNFPPRLASNDGPGQSPYTAVNMSEQGIDIELRAYPTPDSFRFAGYDNKNGHTSDISTDSGMFTPNTSHREPGSPVVTCHIKPKPDVPIGRLYMVTISNGFGSVQYYFNVIGVPAMPDCVDIGLIVGVVVGAAAALIISIVVVVCCCCCKRKGKKSSTQGRSNPTFSENDLDNDSGIDEKDSPHLSMSTSKPESTPAQHQLEAGYVDGCEVRDGVMRKKSARGQAYEVTSLVKGGGARIAGETTKPPATNSNGGYAEPWRDFNEDMPDGQPGVNKSPAHATATRAGNNASPDHYPGPGGEDYASVGEHGRGGNTKAASLKQTDKTRTAAKTAAVNTGNSAVRTSGDHYAKMDDCSGQTPGSHYHTKVDSNQKSKPPYINVPADRPLEMDPSGPSFDYPGYSTVAQASHNKGNKTFGKEMHSGAEFTDARGSDTYDHFGRQGQQSRPYDPTYAHTQDF